MIRQVEYFEKAGTQNTERCLEIVERLVSEGSKHVVVASTSGATGLSLARALEGKGANLVVVTHSVGFKGPNIDECTEEARAAISAFGARIYTGTILTHSLETAIAKEHGGLYPTMMIMQTLRRFGQGVKVCCEIVMEACDAGMIPEGEEVVAVGGTVKGADTVLIAWAVPSKRFLSLKVLEILAKPRG